MPNWCSTTITITHDNEVELKNLYNLIEEWTSKDYMKNGFGHKWLGNIVLGSGVGTVDTGKETDLRCRGTLQYLNCFKDELRIDTETAWSPMLRMWLEIIDKYLPDASIIYSAEEPGCDIYYTNDPVLVGKYVIDSWDSEIESDWEASKNTVIEVLQKLLNTTERNVKKLFSMFYKTDIEGVVIHEWEYVNEYDLN